jgi:hypothetical protein
LPEIERLIESRKASFTALTVQGDTMAWIKWIGVAAAVLTMAVIGLKLYGAYKWAAQTRELVARLTSSRTEAAAVYDSRELEGLPAPVQRFFKAALRDGQRIVAAAKVTHTGTFNMGEASDLWKPFTSKQSVVTKRPGFVWDGRIALMPGLAVNVHDAYVSGEGILHPAFLGLYSLADMRGTGEMARGELMRFFAEAAWYPTALLPSQGVIWEPVDGQSARAMLHDGDIELQMIFRFRRSDGLIEAVEAEARGRTVGGKIVMTPWQGRFWNYAERDGMQVPLEGEAAWLLPEGPKPYWRGLIKSLAYEYAK